MKPELDIFEYIRGTRIRELPSSIQYQTHLTKLDLNSSHKYSKLDLWIESLPYEIGYLVNLEWLDVSNTLITKPPPSMEELNLSRCNLVEGGLPKDFGCFSSLKKLNLNGNNFDHLPQVIGQLVRNLPSCMRFKELLDFTGMLNLEKLDLSFCKKLEEVHHSLGYLPDFSRRTMKPVAPVLKYKAHIQIFLGAPSL